MSVSFVHAFHITNDCREDIFQLPLRHHNLFSPIVPLLRFSE